MATTPTIGRWLFGNQNDFLTQYARPEIHGDARKLRTLTLQIFIYHQSRLLLLSLPCEGKQQTWTAPTKNIPYDYIGPQTIWKVVLRMLKQTIEENKLINLHFLDLHSDALYVRKQWKAEDKCNVKTLRMSLVMMVEEARIDDRTAMDCEGKVGGMKWFEEGEAVELGFEDLNEERVERMFREYRRYITTQNNLIAFAKSRTEIHKVFEYIGNLCKNSLHIRLGLQTVYRGFNIPHAIILVLKDVENSPLTLTDVTQKIFDTIRQDHQEVVARIPLAGGVFKTTEYVVIGKMMNGDVQFKQSVTLEDLEGVLGEEGKLRIEWMHWNRGVKLVEKGGESDGGVDQKAVTRSEARDSVMMTLCER